MNPDNTNYLLNFVLPQGPTGPAGTNIARSAYLATFNNGSSANGISIPENDRLPIDRKELDISGLITLDTTEETIQFNIPGYYKVSFTVSAYVPYDSNSTFNPSTDFISLGFRLDGTDDIFIGTSQWIYNESAIQLTAEGIVAVVDTSLAYELVNLSKRDIYLNSPDLKNINSNSYFSNPLVTIVIEYLGRQGA